MRVLSTRIQWIRHTNPQLFESALQSGNFWIRFESGIVWRLNPGIFFIRWRNKIESSSLPWILYSRWHPLKARCKFRAFYDRRPVAYIPRGVLDTRVNLDTRAGYKWTGKFDLNTNTSGRGNFWIRKQKVADSKISGYMWTRPMWQACSSSHHHHHTNVCNISRLSDNYIFVLFGRRFWATHFYIL